MITSENLLALSRIINRISAVLTSYDITVSDFHDSWKISIFDGNCSVFSRVYSYDEVMREPDLLARHIIDEIAYGYTE